MPRPRDAARDAALESGAATYFTGRPCRRGHVAARRTDSAACTECMRENSRRRHAAIRADPVRWEAELERHRVGGGR